MPTDYSFFIAAAYSATGILLAGLFVSILYQWYRTHTRLARLKRQQSEGNDE